MEEEDESPAESDEDSDNLNANDINLSSEDFQYDQDNNMSDDEHYEDKSKKTSKITEIDDQYIGDNPGVDLEKNESNLVRKMISQGNRIELGNVKDVNYNDIEKNSSNKKS